MQVLLIALLIDVLAAVSQCPNTATCIDRIRKAVADDARFWFGEQWRRNCGGRNRDPVNCLNPTALQKFTSLGGRLFHVKFYHPNYLSNLKVFPRIVYRVRPGSYRACDHDFHLENTSIIEADPDMVPVEPFQIRLPPEIHWPEMNDGHSYVLLMMDVGFGTLNYLVSGFPKRTTVLKPYEPSENFRPTANPLVLLVFRQTNGHKIHLPIPGTEAVFDLTKFIIENELESGLIGINWILVTNDAFAIEKQRLRGTVDNCHSLVETKLLRDRRWEFTNTLPLNDLDSWLSIGYDQPKMDISVCCTRFSLKTRTVPLDPLGDGVIASAAVHSEPRISVLRTPTASETYQRTSRHYVAMIDQRFTLAMFDASANRVHWLVVDIPSASLAAGALDDGDEILPYLPPIPPSPADCRSYVFLLFLQTASQSSSATSNGGTKIADHFPGEHMYRSRFCRGDCLQRNDFNPQSLAARHRLRLSAVNWMSTCYDAFEAHRQIRISRANLNATVTPPEEEEPEIRAEKWAVIPPTVEQLGPEAQICLAMNLTVVDQNCPDCALRNHFTLCNLLLLPLFLLWRNWM